MPRMETTSLHGNSIWVDSAMSPVQLGQVYLDAPNSDAEVVFEDPETAVTHQASPDLASKLGTSLRLAYFNISNPDDPTGSYLAKHVYAVWLDTCKPTAVPQ